MPYRLTSWRETNSINNGMLLRILSAHTFSNRPQMEERDLKLALSVFYICRTETSLEIVEKQL